MRKIEHCLLLSWLLTTGLIAAGAWIIIDQGMLQDLLATDRSYVSVVVIGMYLVGLVHSFERSWHLSCELNRIAETERLLAADPALAFQPPGNDGASLPQGFLSDYLADLLRSRTAHVAGNDAEADLMEIHAMKLRGRNEFGWFLIDLMLKVGFLGTLIGFIWMLASVSQHEVIDATSMQNILKEMSLGMSTALNTTLSSLVGGILLSLPYYMLGCALDELLETSVRLTRVELMPRLAGRSA